VVDDEGNPIRDEKRVFEKWRQDFPDLYNCDDNQDFDDNHYEQTKLHTLLLENNRNDPLYEPNHELNTNITVDESTCILKKAKRGSACGIDDIPYDVLKNAAVIQALQQ